jgi:hypothetical protein
MPYCTQCGIEIPVDARFCPACGAKSPSSEGDMISETTSDLESALRSGPSKSAESGGCAIGLPKEVVELLSEAETFIQVGLMLFNTTPNFKSAANQYRTALEHLLDAILMTYEFEYDDVIQYLDDGRVEVKSSSKNYNKQKFLENTGLLSGEEADQVNFVRDRGNAGTHREEKKPLTVPQAKKAGDYIENLLPAFQDKINQALGDPVLVKRKQIDVFNLCRENADNAGKDDVAREYEERLSNCQSGYFGAAACSSPAPRLVQSEASFAGGSAVGEAKIDQLINSFEYTVAELVKTQQQLDSKRAYVAGFSKNQMASQWREVEAANKEIKLLYEYKCALSEQVTDSIRSINSELNRISGRYGRAAIADLVERANAVAVRAGYGKRTFTASKYYEGGGMKDENLKYGCMLFAIFFFVIFIVMPFLFGWAMRG